MLKKIKAHILERLMTSMAPELEKRIVAKVGDEVAKRVADRASSALAKIMAQAPKPPASEPQVILQMASKATVTNPAYVCSRFWGEMKAAGLLNRHHLPALTVQQVGAVNSYNVHISVPPISGNLTEDPTEYHSCFIFNDTQAIDECARMAVAQVERQALGSRLN